MSTTKQQVEQIIAYLSERGETISVAESLTQVDLQTC